MAIEVPLPIKQVEPQLESGLILNNLRLLHYRPELRNLLCVILAHLIFLSSVVYIPGHGGQLHCQ
jgi:hypothetical protein